MLFRSNKKKIPVDFVLLLILFFATFLRFYHLGFQSAWLDEVHTMVVTDPKYSLKQFHERIISVEGTPHLFFLLTRFLSEIFGHSIFVCRILSAIVGTLSVYFIFFLAKELFNKKAGYITAILLTVNLFHIEYSQEARAYSLLVFFIIISYCQLLIYINNSSTKNAIFLGFLAGLIPNAHIFGILNVVSIYLTLLGVIMLTKNKQLKTNLFKNLFISGIIALVVFYPVVQILNKLSKTQTHWIPKQSLEGIKNAFEQLLGYSQVLLILNSVLILLYIIYTIYILNNKKEREVKNTNEKVKLSFVVILIWLFVNIGAIIIKSYTGDASLILSRYFIGVLPLLILISGYVLSLIPNKIVRNSTIGLIILYSLYNIFITKNYYNKIAKAQFKELTQEIIKQNPNKDKIVSSWGWFMKYYFEDSKDSNVVPSTFQDHIFAMKNDAISKQSFWYFDGNSKPYNLNNEEELFLEQNFILDKDLNNYFDCWAKHYSLKNNLSNNIKSIKKGDFIKLYLNEFIPSNTDGNGNLLIFDNNSVKSKEIALEKGDYTIMINANSLPEIPIDGQNAHVKIGMNDTIIGEYYLSEKTSKQENSLKLQIESNKSVRFQIFFDNDLSKDGKDRNVIIYGIKLQKL